MPSKVADNKLPGVADGRALGKEWDLGVGDAYGILQFVGEIAETRTQHQRDARPQWGSRQDELRRLAQRGRNRPALPPRIRSAVRFLLGTDFFQTGQPLSFGRKFALILCGTPRLLLRGLRPGRFLLPAGLRELRQRRRIVASEIDMLHPAQSPRHNAILITDGDDGLVLVQRQSDLVLGALGPDESWGEDCQHPGTSVERGMHGGVPVPPAWMSSWSSTPLLRQPSNPGPGEGQSRSLPGCNSRRRLEC